MFTGIIENIGIVKDIIEEGSNKTFVIASPLSAEFKIDQSVAHNGVCLTVVANDAHTHTVTAIKETLNVTALNNWQIGDMINLERAMLVGARLDGHFVQGHVDSMGTCTAIEQQNGSTDITIQFDPSYAPLIINKGSICLDGISLTCHHVTENSFVVSIIPYTWKHTNLHKIKLQQKLNLEFDLIGKYFNRQLQLNALKTTTNA